jgi:hypothetical protein
MGSARVENRDANDTAGFRQLIITSGYHKMAYYLSKTSNFGIRVPDPRLLRSACQ